jgi:DNA-binding NtrC family response regulator
VRGGGVAKETILILDNDKNVTWTLKTLFENEGYPVVIVDSVERAIRDFTEFKVSGLITEYWIGNFRTLGAIRKLKEIFPESYVMMITDQPVKDEEYEEVMNSGVDDYFLKPMPIRKLLLHLQKGLMHRSLVVEKKRLEMEAVSLREVERKVPVFQVEEVRNEDAG